MRWRRGRSEKDFASELEAHLAFEAERLRGEGWSEEEARSKARKSFGNVLHSQEQFYESRRWPWFEHLKQDVAYGLRQLAKSKDFTFIAALTLALGIGATTLIFTLVDATLMQPLQYRDGDRILHITDVRVRGRSTGSLVGVPRFFDLQKRSESFDAMGFYFFDHPTLIAGSSLPVALRAAGVNADFWRTIGIAPMLGRTFNAADDRPNAPLVAVISYANWKRQFAGDLHVLNRQVTLDGRAATIVGVLPQGLEYPSQTEIWTPASFDPAQWAANRHDGSRFINVIARLKSKIAVPQAQQEIRAIGDRLRREYASTDGNWQFGSESLREFMYGSMRVPMLVLMGASGVLLVIACINIANLLLSRGTARLAEVSVRCALGASQGRMLAQFLTENLMLGLLGGGMGLLGSYLCLRWFGTYLPGRLGTSGVNISWLPAFVTTAVSMLSGLFFGCVPTLQSRRLDLATTLKQGDVRVGRAGGGRMRTVFIGVQVALSLVLLVGASLLAESLWKLLKSPLGFQPEHVLTFTIQLPWHGKPVECQRFYNQLMSGLQRLPGVIAAGHVSALPTVDWHLRSNFDVDWKARTRDGDAVNVEDRAMGGSYFKAMGIPLLAGRYLNEDDRMVKQPRAMVNQQFVKEYLPEGNVVGRHLVNRITQFEIVGVVGDVRGTAGSIATPPGPEFYFLSDESDPGRSFVVRSRMPADQLAREIRKQVQEIDKTQAVQNIATFDDLLDQSVAQPRFNMGLLSAFAVAATLLACVGIYGVISYAVAQRSTEVGIRMAFGATRGQISVLFLRRTLGAALAGVAAGGIAAWFLTRYLQAQLYGVPPHHLFTFGCATGALLMAALLASLVPAIRAASLSPLLALRRE